MNEIKWNHPQLLMSWNQSCRLNTYKITKLGFKPTRVFCIGKFSYVVVGFFFLLFEHSLCAALISLSMHKMCYSFLCYICHIPRLKASKSKWNVKFWRIYLTFKQIWWMKFSNIRMKDDAHMHDEQLMLLFFFFVHHSAADNLNVSSCLSVAHYYKNTKHY